MEKELTFAGNEKSITFEDEYTDLESYNETGIAMEISIEDLTTYSGLCLTIENVISLRDHLNRIINKSHKK